MEYNLIIIIALLVSVCLVGIVLVQNSKGGGLISQLGSANSVAGVAQTTDFIEKATWVLWGVLIFLCVISVYFNPNHVSKSDAAPVQTEAAAPAADAADASDAGE